MKLTNVLAVSVMAMASAFSATISFNVTTDTGFATSADIALDGGYTAYFGHYTGGTLTTSATFADISTNFDILTSQAFATGGVVEGNNGYLALNEFEFDDSAGFGGLPLYVFITDGGNQNALITGFGNIPQDADVPATLSIDFTASNAASLTYLVGSYDATSPNSAGSGGNVILNIPEPSSLLLTACGMLALLRRKR